MKTITLSNGKEIKTTDSVLNALGQNGYSDMIIVQKGFGSCRDNNENIIKFTYKNI